MKGRLGRLGRKMVGKCWNVGKATEADVMCWQVLYHATVSSCDATGTETDSQDEENCLAMLPADVKWLHVQDRS